MRLASSIITDAIADGLGLPRTNIQNDVIAQGVLYYNLCGKDIWDRFTWNNRYITQFDMAHTNGVITFNTTPIDIVLAVRSKDANSATDEGTFIFSQDQVNSARMGADVEGDRFIHLSDTATGYRRIQISSADTTSTYRILALSKFTEATIESAYDPADPTATPTDYRVLNWLIDHTDYALTLYISDKLRVWDGGNANGLWKELLATSLNKHEQHMQRDRNVYPADPAFPELGDFVEGSGWLS